MTGTSSPPSAAAAYSTTPPAGHDPRPASTLETVHRFTDPEYADLSLLMRTGERSGEVFDALLARGQIVVHPTEVERLAALTTARRRRIIADTREQVGALNAAIRDQRLATGETSRRRRGHHRSRRAARPR